MQDELKQDDDAKMLKSLCVFEGPNQIKFRCFKSALPLDPIKVKYDFLSSHYKNDIFHRVWGDISMQIASKATKLTIPDIVTELWKPTFSKCCRILDSLKNSSMKLRKVDKWFGDYKNHAELETHIYNLFKGVEMCYDRRPPQTCPHWIRSAVGRMLEYWKLYRYTKAAKTVLTLKTKLGLTGEFCKLEKIATQVRNCYLYC